MPPKNCSLATSRFLLVSRHWFKAQVNEAGGGNYQSLINEALKRHIQQQRLERALRKLIREELRQLHNFGGLTLRSTGRAGAWLLVARITGTG